MALYRSIYSRMGRKTPHIETSLFQIRDLVPESEAYMDLLAFERKLDQTIARKRMEIQEAIKKPITVQLKFISMYGIVR